MLTEEVAKLLLTTFRGREEFIAVHMSGSHPEPKQLNGSIPLDKFIERHTNGNSCGVYLLRGDSTVYCACADFDDHDGNNPDALSDAQAFARFLIRSGFPCLFERSQSGTGYHVWVLFSEPIPAGEARLFMVGALNDCELDRTEAFPKQATLTDSKPLGNYVRYPLSGKSCFLDIETLTEVDPVTALTTAPVLESEVVLAKHWWNTAEGIEPVERRHYDKAGMPSRVSALMDTPEGELLARRWMGDVSGMAGKRSRSDICFALATEMIRNYIPTPEIEAAITQWSVVNQYEQGLKRDWVERTVAFAYTGLKPRGEKEAAYSSSRLGVLLHSAIEEYVSGGPPPRITTGVPAVDASMCGGYCLGEYTIVAGRPSQGKSALALHMLDAAARQGYSGVFISLEMTQAQCMKRVLTRLTDIPEAEWSRSEVAKQLHELSDADLASKAPIYYSFGSPKSYYEIETEIRDYHRRGCQVVVVDYMSLIELPDGSDSYKHVTQCTKQFANLARELGIALHVLVQLKRPDARYRKLVLPQMSDLAESGQIERDADNILGVLWPWKEFPTDYEPNVYNVVNMKTKHRGIKEPVVVVNWNPERQMYS